jgi:competence protein ComEC
VPALININTASLEELQYIIYIGPERAGQIIRLRPFDSVDDLVRIDGIGPARLEAIKRQNIVVVE